MESVGGRKRCGNESYRLCREASGLPHICFFFFPAKAAQIAHKKPLHPLFLPFPVGLVWFREVSL